MRPILLTAFLFGSVAAAAEPAGVVQQVPNSGDRPRTYHRIGVQLDAGVPDGIGISGSFRPMHWLRLEVGVVENTVSPGIRGGVSLLPFNYWITPTLTLEGGHYFQGNANNVVRKFDHSLGSDEAILKNFNYDFLNAHAGLEIGSRSFAFYMRVGGSYVSTTLRNSQQFLQDHQTDPTKASVDEAKDVRASYRGPSAKFGFVIYFM